MKKSEIATLISGSTPEMLSKALEIDPNTPEPWEEADLRAMVESQLKTPLPFDLGSVKLSEAQQKTATDSLCEAADANINTFGDLFFNEGPPRELLELAQKFFKSNVKTLPTNSPDQEVSYLFYLLSIGLARICHAVNISKLTDGQQIEAIAFFRKKPWVNARIQELLQKTQKRIVAAGRG